MMWVHLLTYLFQLLLRRYKTPHLIKGELNPKIKFVIYLCYYKTKSLQNVHVWCRGRNTLTRSLNPLNIFAEVLKYANLLLHTKNIVCQLAAQTYRKQETMSKDQLKSHAAAKKYFFEIVHNSNGVCMPRTASTFWTTFKT